jgi:hypothetical protein
LARSNPVSIPESNWSANFAAARGDAPATLPHPDEIADLKPLGPR